VSKQEIKALNEDIQKKKELYRSYLAKLDRWRNDFQKLVEENAADYEELGS